MKSLKIRFNTDCKNKNEPNALCWRAVIDGEEFLCSDIEIKVPVKTISHNVDGIQKWSISCESDNFYIDDKKKLIINKSVYSSCVIWLTGLSGSGKTTIANSLAEKIEKENKKVILLDGDNIRDYFETGFDKISRINHNLKVGKMASMFEKQGFVVIVSLISPYLEAREQARNMTENFIEVYVSTPLKICEERDVKGLYAKARKGEIKNFTGVNDMYQVPFNPDITIDTSEKNIDECANIILPYIKNFKLSEIAV